MASDSMSNENVYLFKPAQLIGDPFVTAPIKDGYLSANIQFIIPDLNVGKSDRHALSEISKYCGLDVFDTASTTKENKETGRRATVVSIAFYIPMPTEENRRQQEAENQGRMILERFMGILSFYAGVKCSAVHAQTNVLHSATSGSITLEPVQRAETPAVEFKLPEKPFNGRIPSENIFIALFWLRRGLAERDPIENFAALMVSLQCIARELVLLPKTIKKCPHCGRELESNDTSITASVRHLVVERLGTEKSLYQSIWKARNAIIAHGNVPIATDIFVKLTELKFEVAMLCYRGIKLAMGIEEEDKILPHHSFFITSAMMYLD